MTEWRSTLVALSRRLLPSLGMLFARRSDREQVMSMF
jgi:hypothetical protein